MNNRQGTIKRGINYLKYNILRNLWHAIKMPILMTKMRYLVYKHTYYSPAPPDDVIWVNPDDISKRNNQLSIQNGIGKIKDGEWDLKGEPFSEYPLFIGLRERYKLGKEWQDTHYYRLEREKLNTDGYTSTGHTSMEEFANEKLEYIDDLYNSIRKNGYIYEDNSQIKHNKYKLHKKEYRYYDDLECLVVIGRDGEIQLSHGHHRLSLCKINNIPQIPVNVHARHEKWQHKRDKLSRSECNPNNTELKPYIDHPDMDDIC